MNHFAFVILALVFLIVLGLITLAYFVSPGQNLKERPMFLEKNPTSFVTLGDVRLHYLKKGTGSPVVLLHGGGTWLYSYRHVIDELAQHHTVYALDMPGHGFTTYSANSTLNLSGFSALLEEFMQSQNLNQADFIGNSWGGGWALHFAQTHPSRVGKLVLIDSSGTTEIARNDGSMWKYLHYPFVGELLVHFFSFHSVKKDIQQNVFHDASRITEAEIRQIYVPLTFTQNLRAQYILQRQLNWRDVESRLGELQNKTLVIWGENDKYILEQFGRNLSAQLNNAHFVVVKNSGHVPHEERPAEVSKLLDDFLQPEAF